MALANQTMEVVCRGTVPGNELWVNVHHLENTAAGPTVALDMADAQAFADIFDAMYEALVVAPGFHEDWSLDTITVRRISGTAGAYEPNGESFEFSETAVGAVTGDPLPPQVAVCVTKKTGLAGRERRGRCYLAGFAESQAGDPSRITTTVAGQIATGFADMAGALQAIDCAYGVFSRSLVVMTPVQQFRVGTAFDTQRRRRGRLVENYQTAVV
jgi:hypothetical protein